MGCDYALTCENEINMHEMNHSLLKENVFFCYFTKKKQNSDQHRFNHMHITKNTTDLLSKKRIVGRQLIEIKSK